MPSDPVENFLIPAYCLTAVFHNRKIHSLQRILSLMEILITRQWVPHAVLETTNINGSQHFDGFVKCSISRLANPEG